MRDDRFFPHRCNFRKDHTESSPQYSCSAFSSTSINSTTWADVLTHPNSYSHLPHLVRKTVPTHTSWMLRNHPWIRPRRLVILTQVLSRGMRRTTNTQPSADVGLQNARSTQSISRTFMMHRVSLYVQTMAMHWLLLCSCGLASRPLIYGLHVMSNAFCSWHSHSPCPLI